MALPADMLAAVEMAIATFLANGAIREYSLADGTTVKRESIKDLYELRTRLQGEVAAKASGRGMLTPIGLRGRC